MGPSSSSNAANLMSESVLDNNGFDSVGGRKSEELVAADFVEVSSDEESSEDDLSLEDDVEDSEEEESDEEDSDDEEEEEEDNERKLIFQDAINLKKLAVFFQHPEKPVEVDGFAAGRSFFTRPDAADVVSDDEDEELADALADAQALKKLASAYLHPERSLEVDATACARNYFSQPWASEQETFGQAEQRARVVEESHKLKDSAVSYRHPEAPVDMEPGMAMGRNYFNRASAEEQVDQEEQALILEEMKALKQLAVDYMHPEKAVVVAATACGRNYFNRASAEEQEEDEYGDDREIVLEEMKELKQAAVDFMHPERAVEMDSTAFGRNYFNRASAEEQEEDEYGDDREIVLEEMKELKQAAADFMHPERPVEIDSTGARCYFDRASAPEEDSEERELILQEMKALKQLAVDYMHPENPVVIDAVASGRNYFSRPSAPEQEEDEYGDDREIVLEEMKELKQAALDYMHPERPVEMDSTGARCYFERASAPEEESEERELILQEMKALKQLAVDYMHPENPVVIDAVASGRNYFSRPSAPEQEEDEYGDDREIVLEEMKELKQAALDYMHPERPVEMDSTGARCYFDRASATEQDEDAYERELVLKEAALMKQSAVDYLHPERPIKMDPAAYGRNYFSRPSAPEQEEDEYGDDREIILEEMKELKQAAVDYMHPEKPVEMDPAATGRNYFTRPSAPEQDEDAYERGLILKEAALMKQAATDYLHPENPVVIDAAASGRNYFSRPSAAEQEDDEYSDDREIILEEMKELKQAALDYMHPERPVQMDSTAGARNYFLRPSAEESEPEDEERDLVLQEMQSLKRFAVNYMHPEKPVEIDATSFGRNYFGRASAVPGDESLEAAQERYRVLAETESLKKLATSYSHPEATVTTTDATVFGRNYFSRLSAPEQETFEEAEERASVLADASALKQLAADYLHPEVSVKTTDPTATARNYFARASAVGAAEHISTAGHANVSDVYEAKVVEEQSHHDDYGHFEMDEEIFYDMRQSIVLPLASNASMGMQKVQSSKMSSEEEGELSRSPSSVMLFTGALEDAEHPTLPTMG